MKAAAILFVVGAMATPFAGQAPRAARNLTGTAAISGTVSDERHQPIRNAIVRLSGSDLPDGRTTITDARGAFIFDRLPEGRFTLTSAKASYLTTAYGALRAGGSGTPIVLAAGQQLSNVSLVMPKGGVISGTIRDAQGVPMPNLHVFALAVGATPVSTTRPDALTDDRGYYRIYGLRAGSYVVYIDRLSSGGLGEIGAMSDGEVDAALARLQSRRPGIAPPATGERTPSSIVRPAATFSTVPVFYPGVVSPEQAQAVQVAPGDEKSGVSFTYQLSRSASVSGTVSGAAADQTVQLTLSPSGTTLRPPLSFGSGPALQRRPSAGDGDFVFHNVTPGQYTLIARAVPVAGGRGQPIPQVGPLLFASASVEVVGEDVAGVTLALRPAPQVEGRVRYVGAAAPVIEPGFLTVQLVPAGATSSALRTTPGVAAAGITAGLRADSTFAVQGVMPGHYTLALTTVPKDWRVKSAVVGGRDALDLPFEVTGNDVAVEIILTTERSQLAGRLLQNDRPAPGYSVVVFASDPALWETAARRKKAVRPGTDGQFTFNDLPAGDYLLAALADAESADWQRPETLGAIAPHAVKVTLGDGERKVQDIRIK